MIFLYQVNLIDKLHNMGVVKPARVDENGQPVEVEHVLQLVEDQGVCMCVCVLWVE